MKISEQGLDFIKSFEGFVPYVYDDLRPPVGGKYREWKGESVRGTLTIGFGHTNAAKHPLKIKLGLKITQEEATEILDVDLDECESQVNDYVMKPLTQGQFDALTSFNFNCGPGNLSKLIAPLNRGDYKTTRAKFDLYIKSKGRTLRGLQRRRDGEQALWDADIPPPLPDEPQGVDHPADVEKEKEPITVGPVGTTVAVGGGAAAIEGGQAVIDTVSTPVPPPPAPVTETVTNVGAWKTITETVKSFGLFAYEQPWLVGAVVVAVLALVFLPRILPDKWRLA